MNKAAQALGRLGGKATSDAKKTAAKKNGKKGGRPKKKEVQHKRHGYFRAEGGGTMGAITKARTSRPQKCWICGELIRTNQSYTRLHNPLNLLLSLSTPIELQHPDKYEHATCAEKRMRKKHEQS